MPRYSRYRGLYLQVLILTSLTPLCGMLKRFYIGSLKSRSWQMNGLGSCSLVSLTPKAMLLTIFLFCLPG